LLLLAPHPPPGSGRRPGRGARVVGRRRVGQGLPGRRPEGVASGGAPPPLVGLPAENPRRPRPPPGRVHPPPPPPAPPAAPPAPPRRPPRPRRPVPPGRRPRDRGPASGLAARPRVRARGAGIDRDAAVRGGQNPTPAVHSRPDVLHLRAGPPRHPR